MLQNFFRNPFFRFVIVSTSLYVAWYLTYEYYLKPSTSFDVVVIDSLVRTAETIMNVAGFELTDYQTADGDCRLHIGIQGSKGVTVGAPCDGAVLYALFICFVAAFPGRSKHKFWFIPVGAFSIYIINALRVVALAVVVNINEDWLAFNHDYTFTIIVYAYVFFLWWLWVNKFSGIEQIKGSQA
jgi:exosortase family protein XrtF